jgi:outer membrane protein assembly factor BamB
MLFGAVSVVAQDSDDWPMHRRDSSLTGVTGERLGDDLELAWTFETEGAIISSPAIVGGVVYVGSGDQKVYAIDLATGVERWSFLTEDIIEAPPLVHDGRVYIGSSDLFFYAIDADTGELEWKRETGDKILGGANFVTADDGTTSIVVGSYDTHLYCFDAKSGEPRWSYRTDNYINGTPAILGDEIVFGGCDAMLHVVSAKTGEAADRIDLGRECHVAGSVALADGRAYLGHYGNEFVCVDLEEADVVWSYPSPRHAFFSSPAIAADRVVFGGRDKKLHCVKRSDGEPLWTFPTRRKIDGSPVVFGDRVVFGSGDGRLYVLNLEDGEEVWSYEIGQPVYSSPAVAGGTIVVGANDGVLYAFRAADDGGGR